MLQVIDLLIVCRQCLRRKKATLHQYLKAARESVRDPNNFNLFHSFSRDYMSTSPPQAWFSVWFCNSLTPAVVYRLPASVALCCSISVAKHCTIFELFVKGTFNIRVTYVSRAFRNIYITFQGACNNKQHMFECIVKRLFYPVVLNL